jgi:putative oxidoreductase
MLNSILYAGPDWAGFIARLTLGIVIFPHGAQKLLGWFGGHGPNGFLGHFEQISGLPGVLGWLVIITEFFGSLCLIAGFASRFWAFAMFCVFVGIVVTSHLDAGFFMNWSNDPDKRNGFEYHLLVLGLSILLMVNGSGRASIDRAIIENKAIGRP